MESDASCPHVLPPIACLLLHQEPLVSERDDGRDGDATAEVARGGGSGGSVSTQAVGEEAGQQPHCARELRAAAAGGLP